MLGNAKNRVLATRRPNQWLNARNRYVTTMGTSSNVASSVAVPAAVRITAHRLKQV